MDIESIKLLIKDYKDPKCYELIQIITLLLEEIKLLNSQIALTKIEYNNLKSTFKTTEEKVVSRLKSIYESGLYNED